MSAPLDPPDWLERLSTGRIATTGGALSVVLLGATLATPIGGDAVLGLSTLGVWGVSAWAWRARRQLDAMPLVLGEVAVRQVVDRQSLLRVRTWLGVGRVMHGVRVEAYWQPPSGPVRPLPVIVPTRMACGPLTLSVVLPDLALGEVEVQVEAQAGGRAWRAVGTYDLSAAVSGPFAPPVRRERGRLAWDRSAWDRASGDPSV